jgi:hypothetical protein
VIIRPAGNSLHLISQPDHAALAGKIMANWQDLSGHSRRAPIMLAVEQHDNGWREPDAAPSIDPATGRVHDFVNAPASVRQGVWPRGVERLSHDPWAAALVAQHALTVYDRYRADPAWSEFLTTMTSMRDALVARTGKPLPELERGYPFVRMGDLISLVYCNPWKEETYRDWTIRFEDDVVTVTPDPFGGREIPFDIAAIEVPDRPFASTDDFETTLRDARRVSLSGTVKPPGPPLATDD